MSGRRLILLMSVSMDEFAGRPDGTVDWLPPASADEREMTLRTHQTRPSLSSRTPFSDRWSRVH